MKGAFVPQEEYARLARQNAELRTRFEHLQVALARIDSAKVRVNAVMIRRENWNELLQVARVERTPDGLDIWVV